jgi:hypothetical protein
MRNPKARLNRNRVRIPSSLISTLARQGARMPGGLLDDSTTLVSLAEVLDAIPDPRRRRGRRYRLGPLLILCWWPSWPAAADWAGITRFAAWASPGTGSPLQLPRHHFDPPSRLTIFRAAAIDHYARVTGGAVPSRPRTDHNPLDREECLLRVVRRMAGPGARVRRPGDARRTP